MKMEKNEFGNKTDFIRTYNFNIKIHIQVHLNELECREKVHFFLHVI